MCYSNASEVEIGVMLWIAIFPSGIPEGYKNPTLLPDYSLLRMRKKRSKKDLPGEGGRGPEPGNNL